MSVSVSMPQLGESVTEGTVTRWLKHEGDHVSADEPLLEVSTDKVDTEIPSPVSGILRGITVAEDETVAVGAELAVIDEDGSAASAAPSSDTAERQAPASQPAPAGESAPAGQPPAYQPPSYGQPVQPAAYQRPAYAEPPAYQPPAYTEPPAPQPRVYAEPPAPQPRVYAEPPAPQPRAYAEPPAYQPPVYAEPPAPEPRAYAEPPAPQPSAHAEPAGPSDYQSAASPGQPADDSAVAEAQQGAAAPAASDQTDGQTGTGQFDPSGGRSIPADTDSADSPYVTPLVRKLAAEHDIDLGAITGTGVGGRIRKQDVLDAARDLRGSDAPGAASVPTPAAAQAPAVSGQPAEQAPAGPQQPVEQAPAGPAEPAEPAAPAHPAEPPHAAASAEADPAAAADHAASSTAASAVSPSSLRGSTERLSRARQVIAQRMVESLQTSAQLTTVVEADVTAIARLRDRAKAAFEAREGIKLSFLPFFALAAVEALKAHPKVNAMVDTTNGTVTYHEAEHLGIAVDTDRGLMVPVIRNAGDLNIGGLARKIADLAQRTRAGQVSPDDLSGGTFTLTNTGSRGALFDTPILNMPQVGILGTGTVNKRAVVVDDPALGEVITVRSMVYLALTYDHRLVDGADAARFLITVKSRLEEGGFEAELGL